MSSGAAPNTHDPWLFGADPTEGILSVWVQNNGRALLWRKVAGRVVVEDDQFFHWVYAQHLLDLPRTDGVEVLECASDPMVDCFPYLLTARDGRLLERQILAGASRRLGRRVARLAELEDYWSVGNVEQYLIWSGKTCFKGLGFDQLLRLQFDLETSALDPQQGRIFMLALRDSSGFETLLEAPHPSQEAKLIADFVALVQQRDPDVIENHNLFGFDLPFLLARAAVLGVPLRLGRAPGPPEPVGYFTGRRGREQRFTLAGRELLDTLDAVWRHDFVARDMPSHGLKDVARYFGVAAPDRELISGDEVFRVYGQDPARVRRYALEDVREVDAISRRLHTPAFALTKMAPRRFERVASAGTATGILEPMLVRAYLAKRAALPRSSDPPNPAPHAGGGLHLFGVGVIKNVVKADVASLYPSLIRAQKIGPRCDVLNVFVHLVERLTALRLEHKAMAGRLTEQLAALSTSDSVRAGLLLEHGEHHAMQAAMKLVVNSAYGYLGAGSMALFADRAAADRITAAGRNVLKLVCHELAARGVELIEADTDGVFFSVPANTSEAQERELVRQVALTLPAGLQLEFDGRSQAMFSHELKNYALLRHDGRLLLRGGALHSSRSEPFGEAFLRAALPALLLGEIAQVRALFLERVHALRLKDVPTGQLAMRVRLSKTPLQYAQTRRVEAMYEALLADGRRDWSVGERLRIYRASSGWKLWSAGLDARDYDVGHYLRALKENYAERLRKAFSAEDFELVFRLDDQAGLFDRPISEVKTVFTSSRF